MPRLALLTALVAALLGGLLWFGLRPDAERVEEVLPPVASAVESAEPEELELPAADHRSAPVGARASEVPAPEDDRMPVTHTPPDLFTGVVIDAGGQPLRGVRVVRGVPGDVRSVRENEPIVRGRGWSDFSTRTDEQGRFTFSLGSEFGDELVILLIELEGYFPAERHSIIERGRAAKLRMARRERAILSVRATDATTGLPVPGFDFTVLYETGGVIWSHLSHTEEGEDGESSQPLFFPRGCDSIEVRGRAQGMTAEDLDDPTGLHRASFHPVAGETHPVHLILLLDRPEREAEALVSGIVYSTISDEILAGAEIHHQDRKVLTGSDGRFRVATVGGGALWVAAEGHDHLGVEVRPGQELELRLPGPAVLFGRVVDADGAGVPGIKLKLEKGDERSPTRSRRSTRIRTDDEGAFSVEMRSGTYGMVWDPDLPGEDDRIVVLELAPGERRELILEREPRDSVILEGSLRAGAEDPAFIQLDGVGAVRVGELQAVGRYRTGPLPLGRYAVLLIKAGVSSGGVLLPPIELSEPGRRVLNLEPSIGVVRGRIEGELANASYVVFVPRGAGGERMETLFGGLDLAEVLGVEPGDDGSFEVPADLRHEGELQLYDPSGLLARRSLDPRRELDIGVWTLR